MKTADEMLEELGYKKKNLDIIFSRFWEEWENEDLAKTFSFNTKYETIYKSPATTTHALCKRSDIPLRQTRSTSRCIMPTYTPNNRAKILVSVP